MTVQELINELHNVANKEKKVCFYDKDGEVNDISMVDHSLSDRVDLNCFND